MHIHLYTNRKLSPHTHIFWLFTDLYIYIPFCSCGSGKQKLIQKCLLMSELYIYLFSHSGRTLLICKQTFNAELWELWRKTRLIDWFLSLIYPWVSYLYSRETIYVLRENKITTLWKMMSLLTRGHYAHVRWIMFIPIKFSISSYILWCKNINISALSVCELKITFSEKVYCSECLMQQVGVILFSTSCERSDCVSLRDWVIILKNFSAYWKWHIKWTYLHLSTRFSMLHCIDGCQDWHKSSNDKSHN